MRKMSLRFSQHASSLKSPTQRVSVDFCKESFTVYLFLWFELFIKVKFPRVGFSSFVFCVYRETGSGQVRDKDPSVAYEDYWTLK